MSRISPPAGAGDPTYHFDLEAVGRAAAACLEPGGPSERAVGRLLRAVNPRHREYGHLASPGPGHAQEVELADELTDAEQDALIRIAAAAVLLNSGPDHFDRGGAALAAGVQLLDDPASHQAVEAASAVGPDSPFPAGWMIDTGNWRVLSTGGPRAALRQAADALNAPLAAQGTFAERDAAADRIVTEPPGGLDAQAAELYRVAATAVRECVRLHLTTPFLRRRPSEYQQRAGLVRQAAAELRRGHSAAESRIRRVQGDNAVLEVLRYLAAVAGAATELPAEMLAGLPAEMVVYLPGEPLTGVEEGIIGLVRQVRSALDVRLTALELLRLGYPGDGLALAARDGKGIIERLRQQLCLLPPDPAAAPAVVATPASAPTALPPAASQQPADVHPPPFPLVTWDQILAAANELYPDSPWKMNRSGREMLLALSRDTGGPIARPTKRGGHPSVDRYALLDWLRRLRRIAEETTEEDERSESDRKATLAATHKYGRAGRVAPELNGAVKKRRKK